MGNTERKKELFDDAEAKLRERRVVDHDIFRATLRAQHEDALNAKDFAKAEEALKQIKQLDTDVQDLQYVSLY